MFKTEPSTARLLMAEYEGIKNAKHMATSRDPVTED
jgi:predicted DNA-binding protein (MmcQ/YjbR family)